MTIMKTRFTELTQLWPMPSTPKPIVVIGAGGIVRDAHLPAYQKWGLPVAGIYDRDLDRAKYVASEFGIETVHTTLEAAMSSADGLVYDIALPPQALVDVLPHLPKGATALIQKPLGVDVKNTEKLLSILRQRRITAATNFQLRFTPSMVAISDAIAKGMFGDIVELEVRLACRTPWELWPFMADLEAVEIPLHSIHYLDWIRSVVGMPAKVYARSVSHPDHPRLRDARSSIILDYGPSVRCCLSLNHTHKWGPEREEATLRIEGTKAAAIVGLGYLVNFPEGAPESLSMIEDGCQWETVPLQGGRVPDSFAAVMANLQRFSAGEDAMLVTDVNDSLETMVLVDACLRSNKTGEAVAPETIRRH